MAVSGPGSHTIHPQFEIIDGVVGEPRPAECHPQRIFSTSTNSADGLLIRCAGFPIRLAVGA